VKASGAQPEWRPAQFWRREGERAVCTLCPFECALVEGSVGRCRVRRRHGAEVETATFATSVWHLQPVERKPLYHFRPGRSALTLAAPGCTFRCDYCQNARISQFGQDEAVAWSALPVDPARVVAEARDRGALIALSYSEPVLSAELTLALRELARPAGVEIVWKSNGFISPAALAAVAPALAAVNVDLKSCDDAAHRRLTGAPVAPVLARLHAFARAGVWLEVSTPLIPGFNTDPSSLRRMAEAVLAVGPETPWHLLRFHPDYRHLAAPPTSPALLQQALELAREVGLRHVYVERALGEGGRNTHCPACGTEVVSRGIWALERVSLVRGACPACGEAVAGRW
jgi:pyruvate formate lyase activating enzyme